MKRLEFVGLNSCPRCRRAVAYLTTVDGKDTLAIALDGARARELSLSSHRSPRERSLTEFFLELLVDSGFIPRQVVIDLDEEGVLCARADLTTTTLICCPQEGVALATQAGIPLYAAEEIFRRRPACHTPEESLDPLQKLKPTLH